MTVIQTSEFVIPSSPAIQEKIAKMVREVSDLYTQIDAKKTLIKDTIAELSDEHDIPKNYLNKVCRIYHKGTINAVSTDNEAVENLYEVLFKTDEQ